MRRSISLTCVVAVALPTLGCPADDSTMENVLPSASQGTTTMDATETAEPTMGTNPTATSTTTPTEPTGMVGGDFPATFRFNCIDIQTLGDADGDALQAQVLENAWADDIANFKLNIMLEVVARDDAGGTADLGIRSGVGPGAPDLCSEPTAETEMIVVDYTPETTQWGPTDAGGECSVMEVGTGGGTYDMVLSPTDVVYLYAEDDNTVSFNCTQDASPDAVPIRAVEAQVSANADETFLSGSLTGCIQESEAQALCSCLVECPDNMGPGDLEESGECMGCPTGSTPLANLLGGVGTTDRCTGLLGEPGFDLLIGFTADRLPNVPTTCGG